MHLFKVNLNFSFKTVIVRQSFRCQDFIDKSSFGRLNSLALDKVRSVEFKDHLSKKIGRAHV